MALRGLLKLAAVQSGKELVGEAIAENPCIRFEEMLPDGFRGPATLPPLGLEEALVVQQLLEAFQLRATVSHGNKVALQIFVLGEIKERLLVLGKDAPCLRVIEDDLPQRFV